MKNQKNVALAMMFIGMGIYFLASKFILIAEGLEALIVGMIFLISYFISGRNHTSRNKVYLTFGSLSISFGGAYMMYKSTELFEGYIFYIAMTAMAIGLFIIHFVSEGRTEVKGKYVQSWALRLGILILVVEGIVYITQIFTIRELLFYISNYWPIILIVIGVMILIKEFKNIKTIQNKKEKEKI